MTFIDNVQMISVNESIYDTVGEVHSMENIESELLTLIEVHAVIHFGEDCISHTMAIYAEARGAEG